MSIYQPARKIKKSSVKNIVLFPSSKNERSMLLESLLEYRFALYLEFDDEVLAYEEQPRTFKLKNLKNKKSRYTPDFLLYLRDGREIYIEVKPSKIAVSEDYQHIFSEFKNNVKPLDSEFALVTEQYMPNDIRTSNLQLLLRYRKKHLINYNEISMLKSKLVKPIKLRKLRSDFDLKGLYALISFGFLQFNIDTEILSDKSKVWINV